MSAGQYPSAVFPLWRLWKALGSDCALCLQARLEVHRFGITGYGKGKERVLEQERAIMLGARVSGCLCLPPPAGLQQRGTPKQGRLGDAGKCLQDKK